MSRIWDGPLSFPSLPRASVLGAIARRDLSIARSYRLALLFDAFFGVVTLFTFYFVSETFDRPPSASLGAAPNYFAFVAAGVAVAVVTETASGGLARRLREEQLTGTLEALVVQPISAGEIALGLAGFPFLFASVRAPIYLVFGSVFLGLDLGHANWLGFAINMLLSALALGALGILLGAIILVIKRGEAFASVLTFGLGLVSGALFPVSVLPGWAEAIGRLAPPRYVFSSIRDSLFEGAVWTSDSTVLLALSATTIPLSIWVFSSALRWTRRRGTLGQY